MAYYYIAGTANAPATLYVIDYTTKSLDSIVDIYGDYQVYVNNGNEKITMAVKEDDGHSLSYSKVTPIEVVGGGLGQRGLFGGGSNQSLGAVNVISYIGIDVLGNAQDFGDLTQNRYALASMSNGVNDRGVFFGGYNAGPTVDHVAISTTGNATAYDNISLNAAYCCGLSNGVNGRGVVAGFDFNDYIRYFNIMTDSQVETFGHLSVAKDNVGSCSNATNNRGLFAGGMKIGNVSTNAIEYININSAGDSYSFGSLTQSRWGTAGCSDGENNTGVFAGGVLPGTTSRIDYVNISSTGNAAIFGGMTYARDFMAATSNGVNERGIIGGGFGSNQIIYITINSPSDSTYFGNLTLSGDTSYLAACSNA